ncbi:MAG: glycosyltransferase [Microthrixaceae bacterium]
MSLLRRVLAIGVVATLVDVGGLVLAVEVLGWPVVPADAAAVGLATLVSFALHSARGGNAPTPGRRWFSEHGAYWRTALVALVADVAVLGLLVWWLDPGWWLPLMIAKVLSLTVAFVIRSSNYRHLMFQAVRADQSAPACRAAPPGVQRLSVVIPAYREADWIATTVERVRAELAGVAESGGLEVIVVDDGSPDGTAERAEEAGADVVLRQEVNRGKGAAVRAGMLVASGRTVAFTDADLSYAPAQIERLLQEVESGWDVVVGSRRHTNTLTVVRAGRLREFGGRVINLFTGVVLLGRYLDTQCGLKAFRSDVARLLFGHAVIDGFAFDVEVLHLVERYRLTLTEVPVEVENSERSTVNVARDAVRLLVDLLRIRHGERTRTYDVDGLPLPSPGTGERR